MAKNIVVLRFKKERKVENFEKHEIKERVEYIENKIQ